MTQSVNLSSKIHLKTNPILANSICLLKDTKYSKIFIAHSKGVHTYNLKNLQFQQIKIPQNNGGILSCLTQSDDLVFFCYGMKIYGCGINGKTLYQTDTFLAVDKIDAIHVYGYQLWLVSGNMISQFLIGGVQLSNKQTRITNSPAQKIQDVSSQMYDTKINHSVLIKIDAQKPFLLILKNNNQLQCFDKKQLTTLSTSSPPTYAYLYPNNTQNTNKVLVGTMNGQIMYCNVQRNNIKIIWKIIDDSKGKINCIVQVLNGFIIFRDGVFQMWTDNRQCLGKQSITDKIYSALFLPQQQSIFYGSTNGNIVQMFNYEKMIKLSKQKNEKNTKQKLIKEIQQLYKIKQQLKLKADKVQSTTVSGYRDQTKCNYNLSIDYNLLCYNLQVTSEKQIIKIILKGDISLVNCKQKIIFQSPKNNQIKTYVLSTSIAKNQIIKFKYQQGYHQNDKLYCTIFNDVSGKIVISNIVIDLKCLNLHHKIQSKIYDKSNLKTNILTINGQYKYSMMSNWLNSIFNDFGSPSLQQQFIQLCYESLITKNKVYIQFKDKITIIYSQSPTPLSIIKKVIFQKIRGKNISLSYDVKTNKQAVQTLLKKLEPKLKLFEQIKKQYQLLPGLIQLQSQDISEDLKQILSRNKQIGKKYNETDIEYKQLKISIKQFMLSYRNLNNKQNNSYLVEQIQKYIDNFNLTKILKLLDN